MLFLEYPACSTCKKAKNWLMEQGIAFEARHIKENNPTYAVSWEIFAAGAWVFP